jgi:hypothetical protein
LVCKVGENERKTEAHHNTTKPKTRTAGRRAATGTHTHTLSLSKTTNEERKKKRKKERKKERHPKAITKERKRERACVVGFSLFVSCFLFYFLNNVALSSPLFFVLMC